MKVLALDTTTRAGSLAIVVDDVVIDERSGDESRTHAERLPGELLAIAHAHDLALADFDLFAVASGPGSFTGLRIGIATMQGLAFVCRRRIVGVSVLESLAQYASVGQEPGALVAAWMDAHRGEVFAALYRIAAAPAFDPARLIEIDPASVGDPMSVLGRWRGTPCAPSAIIGDGAGMYAAGIAHELPEARILPPPALAGAIGRLGAARAARGETVDPAGIQPLYVRRPDAELDREKRR
jgi:tRNA threonylcarbamoyladenosine biosynthesis protein TsaB